MSAPAPAIWCFDVISPFAYVALSRLPEIARHRPVVLKPIVFGAVLKHWGQLGPAEIAPKRIHTYRLVTHAALSLGLPIWGPADKVQWPLSARWRRGARRDSAQGAYCSLLARTIFFDCSFSFSSSSCCGNIFLAARQGIMACGLVSCFPTGSCIRWCGTLG